MIMTVLLLLCSCGTRANLPPSETMPEVKTIPREEDIVSDERFQLDTEEEPSDTENVFRNQVYGVYIYEPGDEIEKRCFEISCIDGQFYLEYDGEYDYAGAELKILSMDIKNSNSNSKRIDFEGMMYPFSSFSFAGEYWGRQ